MSTTAHISARRGVARASAPAETREEASGAVELVVRQRRAIEAVLRRHQVPADEAAALVGAAVVAVTAADCAGAAPEGSEGRLVRALEIACARRGGGPARPQTFEPSFAARLAAALPEGPPQDAVPAPPAEGAADADSEALFASVVERVAQRTRDLRARLAAERRAAPAQAAALMARPSEADAAVPASHGFVEHLLAAATAAWVEDAHLARALAAAAVRIVRRLDPEVYGATSLADLEARALATLANAERVIGDLAAADAGLVEAGRVLAGGSRDPRARADLLRLQATLRRAQDRRDESLRLLDQAAAIYRWLGDDHDEARTLLQRAALADDEDPRQAAALARRALEALDLAREPRLELVAVHNLAGYLHRAGEIEQAAELLPRAAAAATRLGGRLDRLRHRWLVALIAADRGEAGAERELAAVRDAFVAHEMPLDAILASLDLAALHLSRGRTAETRRVAEEIVPLVAQRPLDRQVLAALLVFQQAARADRATVALARAAGDALRRGRAQSPPAPRPS